MMVSALARGFTSGFLFAIPPGPASTALLQASSEKNRWKKALRLCGEVLLSDLLILIAIVLAFQSLSSVLSSPWLKAAGGLFLLVFAIRQLFFKQPELNKPKMNLFWINLLNPAVWIALLTLVSLGSENGTIQWTFVLGFEAGVFVYYLFLFALSGQLSLKLQRAMHKGALVLIGIGGLWMLLTQQSFAAEVTCDRV
ncbi:MAG TPA: hypothetical protein VEF04_16280, partial [Blastocatellia bacterium]|nr:hypothetical protein [Blastocatellia bacterium]